MERIERHNLKMTTDRGGSMQTKRFTLTIVILLAILAASGCSQTANVDLAVEQTLTINALSTIVQATLAAAPVEPEVVSPATTTSAPPTEAPPTETPAILFTPTSAIPIARILQNTNCRSGPGTVYDIEYIALIGEELVITGRTTAPDYVIVEIPDKPGQYCWLWTNFVEIQGDIASLAVSTPPPTPTPSVTFKVVFDYVDSCVGWDPAFKITNTGTVTFKSYYVKVTDLDTSMVQDHTADQFDKTGGCPVVTAIPQLDPGMNGWAYAYSYPYNPAGHSMQASIKLCTGTGLSGTCVTKSLGFTP
jgi:hypothetical protein